MRLYLSSFRIGAHGGRLLSLLRGGRRVRVIANGLDGARASAREAVFERTSRELTTLGLDVRELDLRTFFDGSEDLDRAFREVDLIWACGGNAFTLNMAMHQSLFAGILKERLQADAVAYGGYSAGAVVAGNTLHGIELVDSAEPDHSAPAGYRREISWDGLGLVPYAIVPHYRSDHWESEKIESVVRHCVAEGIDHRALRDGEVILVDGAEPEFLPASGEPSTGS